MDIIYNATPHSSLLLPGKRPSWQRVSKRLSAWSEKPQGGNVFAWESEVRVARAGSEPGTGETVSSDDDGFTGYCETRFPTIDDKGVEGWLLVPACPQNTEAYTETARRLGYEGTSAGRAQMSREHELCHLLLSVALDGLFYSPTLWAVANDHRNGCGGETAQWAEEDRVCAFQRLLNAPLFPDTVPVALQPYGDAAYWVTCVHAAWRALREFPTLIPLTGDGQAFVDVSAFPRLPEKPVVGSPADVTVLHRGRPPFPRPKV